MLVMLNTRALFFRKTGIGYYTTNLYDGLMASKEADVLCTLAPAFSNAFGLMSKASVLARRVLGDSLLKVTIPVGDFLISRFSTGGKAHQVDIYHEPNYETIPEGRWKTIVTIHDITFIKYPEMMHETNAQRCLSNLQKLLGSDRLIVPTAAIREELLEHLGVPKEKVDTIPLAPAFDYRPVDRASGEGKEKVKAFVDGPYMLYVGTIEPRKNIPTLFRAFRLLAKKHGLKLVLAGTKGWLYDDILKLPAELGIQDSLVFTGYIDEETLLYLYNYASLVVSPSFYEGFGLPVIEAMASGAPALVTDIGAHREVSGGATVLFDPNDHEELAKKAEEIILSDTLTEELRAKGLSRASEFSWQKTVALTIETYKKALEG